MIPGCSEPCFRRFRAIEGAGGMYHIQQKLMYSSSIPTYDTILHPSRARTSRAYAEQRMSAINRVSTVEGAHDLAPHWLSPAPQNCAAINQTRTYKRCYQSSIRNTHKCRICSPHGVTSRIRHTLRTMKMACRLLLAE